MSRTSLIAALAACLCLAAAPGLAQPADPEKEEVPVGTGDKAKDEKAGGKKLTVFELVGKLLKIKVAVKGPKVKPEVAAEIAGKIEGAIKDCAVKEIQANQKYLVNDDKVYRARTALSTRLEAGVFRKVKASVGGKSPIMKTCMAQLEGLETGYGEMNQQITATIETGLK